jgi:NAD(P)-dependent dehydrogenase (short-subunit alcohol dehydrogenase family)
VPELIIYSVSKSALIMLKKVTAKEWGADKVHINAIGPDLIKTKFSRALSYLLRQKRDDNRKTLPSGIRLKFTQQANFARI